MTGQLLGLSSKSLSGGLANAKVWLIIWICNVLCLSFCQLFCTIDIAEAERFLQLSLMCFGHQEFKEKTIQIFVLWLKNAPGIHVQWLQPHSLKGMQTSVQSSTTAFCWISILLLLLQLTVYRWLKCWNSGMKALTGTGWSINGRNPPVHLYKDMKLIKNLYFETIDEKVVMWMQWWVMWWSKWQVHSLHMCCQIFDGEKKK